MSSHQVNSEVINNLLHSTERFPQDRNQNQWMTSGDFRLIEGYLRKEKCILVNFRVRGIATDFIALFQREGNIGDSDCVLRDGRKDYLSGLAGVGSGHNCLGSEKEPVLVNVVEAMQAPEGVIPSLVWFNRSDFVYDILPNALYLSVKAGLLIRGSGRIIGDREARLDMRNLTVTANQRTCQVIKGASEVLKDIPGNETDIRRNIIDPGQTVNWLSSIRIALYSEAIRASSLKPSDCTHEILDVLVGPVDL